MIPALVIGFQMGFTLGPKLQDSAEVSRQISEAISRLYRGNLYLIAWYITAVALLVLWRARVVSRSARGKQMLNGAMVGAIPALLEIAFLAAGVGGVSSVIAAAVFVGIGAMGGSMGAKSGPRAGSPAST